MRSLDTSAKQAEAKAKIAKAAMVAEGLFCDIRGGLKGPEPVPDSWNPRSRKCRALGI